jgi:nicotinate-nucleotide adenylyltransferase
VRKKERIGAFGGTFNPIHSGHLRAAAVVQERFLLDKVLFIASYIPPHKNSVDIASALHRLRMVEIAVRRYPRFIPCSIEVEAKGKSYSILTLNKLKELYPEAELFFILGIDAFLEIDTWRDYEHVLNQCYFVVITRPGYHLEDAGGILGGRYKEKIHKLGGSEVVEDDLLSSFKIFLLPIEALDIASTKIRKRLKRGESVKAMVSEGVEDYIKKNNLYRD